MALLLGALSRGALAAYGDYQAGRLLTAGAAIQQVVNYVLTALPETVAAEVKPAMVGGLAVQT